MDEEIFEPAIKTQKPQLENKQTDDLLFASLVIKMSSTVLKKLKENKFHN